MWDNVFMKKRYFKMSFSSFFLNSEQKKVRISPTIVHGMEHAKNASKLVLKFTIKLTIVQMAFILKRKTGVSFVLFLAGFVLLSIFRLLEFSFIISGALSYIYCISPRNFWFQHTCYTLFVRLLPRVVQCPLLIFSCNSSVLSISGVWVLIL